MDTPELPVISQTLFEQAFSFLEKLQVELDENPLDFGPRRLNNKVAQARQMLTHTEKLYNRVSQWLQKYKAAHRAAETSLDLAKKHLFANDPETRAGRNHTTQDAIASIKLGDDVREVARLSSIIEDLTALMMVINTKRSDLKDVQARLRDQIKLCHEEIGLGNHWGSKVPTKTGSASDVVTLSELMKLLEGVKVKGEKLVQDAEVAESELDKIDQILGDAQDGPSPDLSQEVDEVIPAPVVAQAPTPTPTSIPAPPVSEPEPQSPTPQEPVVEDQAEEGAEVDPVEEEEGEAEEPVFEPSEAAKAEPSDLECFPQIGFCAKCGKPQYLTDSGEVCADGHGGAGTVDHPDDAEDAPQAQINEPVDKTAALSGAGTDRDSDAFLNKLGSETVEKENVDVDDILAGFGITI